MNPKEHTHFTEELRSALEGREDKVHAEWDAKPAAVLIPMYWDVDEWHLLYTRRTEAVESHRGQVSFPGGVIESQDNGVEAAALRETYEEIGIHADDVNILGRLDTMLTVTQFSITPVVGTIPWPYDLRINNNEVAHTFGVPISWLADPANLEFSERELPVSGQKVPVYFYHPYQGEVIWGATARITLNFLQILGMRPGK